MFFHFLSFSFIFFHFLPFFHFLLSSSDSHASHLTAMFSTASVQFSAAEKGWRSDDSSSSLDESSHRWVPARTPTVHRCPNSGEAVGGPTSSLVSSGSSTDAETKSYLTGL